MQRETWADGEGAPHRAHTRCGVMRETAVTAQGGQRCRGSDLLWGYECEELVGVDDLKEGSQRCEGGEV